MGEKTVRFGLVGCGGFGPGLARYFRPVADLAAMCDTDPDRAKSAAAELDFAGPRFTRLDDLLERADVDFVVLTTPNATHAPLTVAAARAGKHVFCEKSMAANLRQCWDMVRASREAGVKLTIGHKRRLRPPWATAAQLAAGPELGGPVAIDICCFHEDSYVRALDEDTWWKKKDVCGGLLQLIGVHKIDWLLSMCGPAEAVSAMYGRPQDETYDYPDSMLVHVRFKSGAVASLSAGVNYTLVPYRMSTRPQVICRNGALRMKLYLDHIDVIYQVRGGPVKTIRFDDLGYDHAFALETRSFVEWIQTGKKPVLGWEEGLRVVEIMEAAYVSADQGGKLVELPLYPELEPAEPIVL